VTPMRRRTLIFRSLTILSLVLSVVARTTAQTAQQPEAAATLAFTEGPTVDRQGNLYFSEMVNQRIMKLSPDGVLSTFREKSNNANGLVIDPEGRLIAAEGSPSNRNGVRITGTPRITRTDLQTGKMEVLADNYQGTPLQGPNDVTIDGKGRIYFTDPGATGAVYRIDAPGKLARLAVAPEIARPNGIQVSPDDTRLYLADSAAPPNGVRLLRVFDLLPDGSVRNMRVLYDFQKVRGIDGMSVDTQGNIYGAAGSQATGNTGIHVISPEGKLLRIIPIPEDPITNDAFGGPDMKTLYVTAGKTVYKVRTEIPGLPR
jgi:gluconolactonase